MTDRGAPIFPEYVDPPPCNIPSIKLLGELDATRGNWQRVTLIGVITEVPDQRSTTSSGFKSMIVIKDPSCTRSDSPRLDFLLFVFSKSSSCDGCWNHTALVVGNMVCVRNVKLEVHKGKMDGRIFSMENLLLFSESAEEEEEALVCVSGRRPSSAEEVRLSWLSQWWRLQYQDVFHWISQCHFTRSLSRICHTGLYSLYVEIIDREVMSDAVRLHVRDGSSCRLPLDVSHRVQYCSAQFGVMVKVTCSRCIKSLQQVHRDSSIVLLKNVRLEKYRHSDDDDGGQWSFRLMMTSQDEAIICALDQNLHHCQQIRHRIKQSSTADLMSHQVNSDLCDLNHVTGHTSDLRGKNGRLTTRILRELKSASSDIACLQQLKISPPNSTLRVQAHVRLREDGLCWYLVCSRCGECVVVSKCEVTNFRLMPDLRAVKPCGQCGCLMLARLRVSLWLHQEPWTHSLTSDDLVSVEVSTRSSGQFLDMAEPAVDSLHLTSSWVIDQLSRLDKCDLLVSRLEKGHLYVVDCVITDPSENTAS